jgi:DNA replication protein DnaC
MNCRSAYCAPDDPERRHHEKLCDPTLADAILDRVIHNAYRIELAGESLRKRGSPS